MSIYSDISKRIGWEGHCAIPSPETAKELHDAVVNDHCQEAFEMVFKIHRFSPSPETDEEYQASNLIWKAYKAGSQLFK